MSFTFRPKRRVVALIVGALVLGYAVPVLSRGRFLSSMTPDQVIAFLSAVSSGMMAFTGIVFSLLFVLLQFGTTAYSPRIVDILGRSGTFYDAAGVFTGTFLYTLMALRGVGRVGAGGTSQLPVVVAFAWLIASVVLLLKLVQSLAGMTHTAVLHMLANTGHAEIARLYEAAPPERPDAPRVPASRLHPGMTPQRVLYAGRMRYVVALKADRLAELARTYDAIIHVPVAVGDPVVERTPLALVYRSASAGPIPEQRVRDCIDVGRERVLEGNPKYAIRLLVDIAIRGLSPAVNDPTTAVQVLDHIESLLLHLGRINLDVGRKRDTTGQLRIVQEVTSWDDYVDLSLTEIQQYGADSVQIQRRVASLLACVFPRVPADRRAWLERWVARHQTTINDRVEIRVFRADAQQRDRQGLGHTSPDSSRRASPHSH